jgi:hypothetical protein
VASRRTIRTGPPVRGLTDFPEHAAPEHSTQALNVEFVRGGVSTRQGCERVSGAGHGIVEDSLGVFVEDVAVKLLVAIEIEFNWLVAFGFVPRVGAEHGSEQIYLRWYSTFVAAGNPAFDQIINLVGGKRDVSSRWDSCLFQQLHRRKTDLIVCTDGMFGKHPNLLVSNWDGLGGATMNAVTGIDRVVTPYHGNVVNPSAYADDPTTAGYSTSAMKARFCRPHEGRLILAHIHNSLDPLVPPNARSMVWYSNFGDAMGWPVENIYPAWENDHTKITGLGSWNGNIVVFRETSIGLFRLVGGSPTYKHAVNGRGCIAHATITEDVNGAIVFLASDGIYAFSGSSQLTYLSKHIERTLRGILESQPEAVRGAHATHYQKARQVWFAFPQNSGEPDIVLVMDYNYNEPAWSMFTYSGSADSPGRRQICGLSASPDGQSVVALIKRQESKLLDYARMDSGTTDFDDDGDPLAVQSLWESGPIEYNTNGVDRWRHLRLALRPMGSHTMTAWWRRDEQAYNDDTLNGQSRGFVPTLAGVLLGAFVLGVDRLGSSEDHSVRVDIHRGGVGRYGRVGVKSPDTPTDTTSPMDIRGFELDVLDKQTRR